MSLRLTVLAVAMTACTFCMAQDSLRIAQAKNVIPRHAIKFSPFHLLSFYPTVQLAYEAKVAPLITIQFDGGIVIDTYNNNSDFKNKRGYKIKVEPRYYVMIGERSKMGWYLAAELYRNAIDFERSSDETECFDQDCLNRFTRRYTYRVDYREHGLALKFGFVKHFHPFLLDVSSGFAVRFIDYSAPSYVTLERQDAGFLFEVPIVADRTGFAPVINFRIGYRIP